MSYFKNLGLQKEPFSTSPNPEFFYPSISHDTALKRLEISIRLRRGLSLILGDVGAGKTTLLRALIQNFKEEDDFIFHMILDSGHKSEFQFLSSLVRMFGIMPATQSSTDFKQALEKYLFEKGVEENKTIVLLIDEGQKITAGNLEVLRMFLNYETNEYKLIQLVITAQLELLPRIRHMHNFMERAALKYTVNPLNEKETGEMINFRLKQAGYKGRENLFSDDALKLIYEHTAGVPRRVAMLCHDALEKIVMYERCAVDAGIINDLVFCGAANER